MHDHQGAPAPAATTPVPAYSWYALSVLVLIYVVWVDGDALLLFVDWLLE
ncbi:MAG: hypothetical protein ACTHK5_07135 [Tsuneonella sp.]